MPFMVHDSVYYDGHTYQRAQIVSDALGSAIMEHHPGVITRIPHDDDLCNRVIDLPESKCQHESHPWNQPAVGEQSKDAVPDSDKTKKTVVPDTLAGDHK